MLEPKVEASGHQAASTSRSTFTLLRMADVDVDALRAKATMQGSKVRQLKKDGATSEEITAAVDELKALKLQLIKATADDEGTTFEKNRADMDDLLKQRMFVVPSFEVR